MNYLFFESWDPFPRPVLACWEADTGGVLQKKFLLKISKIDRKTVINYQVCNFIKKEIPTQVFSCNFCKFFQNTFFTEHFLATASARYIGSFYFHAIEMFDATYINCN